MAKRLDGKVALITGAGSGSALALAADVRDAAAVDQALQLLERKFGALHVLVNNAGIARKKMFEQIQPEEWNEIWDTNLTGALTGVISLCKESLAHPMRPGVSSQPEGRSKTLRAAQIHRARRTNRGGKPMWMSRILFTVK